MDPRNVPGTRSHLKHTSLLPKSCPVREVVALSGGGGDGESQASAALSLHTPTLPHK